MGGSRVGFSDTGHPDLVLYMDSEAPSCLPGRLHDGTRVARRGWGVAGTEAPSSPRRSVAGQGAGGVPSSRGCSGVSPGVLGRG